MIRCTHQWNNRSNALRPAVFLDRDGTLTEYRGFITEPSQIEIVEGACEALHSLRSAGFAIVLITNQSAIGRGMINDDQLNAIHSELVAQLSQGDTYLDAIYYCPEVPIGANETIIESEDRKPGPGMLLAAAKDLNLDLPRSWMIGDRISDILAGQNATCRGNILINSDRLTEYHQFSDQYKTSNTLRQATAFILSFDTERFGFVPLNGTVEP